MNRAFNFVTIDNPNIGTRPCETIPFGQFIPQSTSENRVKIQDLFLPNFSMRISEGQLDSDAMLINTASIGLDYIGSCLFLKGNLTTYLHSQQDGVSAYEGTQGFKYDPQNEFRHRLPAGAPFRIAHFSVKPDYFLDLLPVDESWAHKLAERIKSRERILSDKTRPITMAQAQALEIILNPPINGRLGELMVETAITQVILLQLDLLFNRGIQSENKVSLRDKHIAREVKGHLEVSFLDDHSLPALAQHFGVNTNKLMYIFKHLVGKSIFEYISELKMNHARVLLEDGDKQVIEIARILGYKNAQHFTTAFKKKFGMTPTVLKR